MRTWKVFVKHMLMAIENIRKAVGNMDKEEFISNEIIREYVVRKIGIIGEAARHIPDDIREEHPEIPWKRIVGMRNKIIHAYFDVYWDAVWDVVTIDLPVLENNLRRLWNEEGD